MATRLFQQTFQDKEISVRLLRPIEGQSHFHGVCRKLLASGILLDSLFIPTENIDLYWIDEKGIPR